jgi:hypothetical protein
VDTMFVTKEEGLKPMLKVLEAWMATNPERWDSLPTRKLMEASGWSESRTWQVARRRVIEARQPGLIVDVSALVKGCEADKVDQTIAKVVIALRDKGESWGEINVRMGLSEGRVRKLFAQYSGRKDRGLRTGQGGRFVTDNPTLYLDNMKSEGAVISGDYKGIPAKPELCLNYKKAPKVRAPRKPKAKVVEAAA